eukprot:166709-Prymnesium_polylepis.4
MALACNGSSRLLLALFPFCLGRTSSMSDACLSETFPAWPMTPGTNRVSRSDTGERHHSVGLVHRPKPSRWRSRGAAALRRQQIVRVALVERSAQQPLALVPCVHLDDQPDRRKRGVVRANSYPSFVNGGVEVGRRNLELWELHEQQCERRGGVDGVHRADHFHCPRRTDRSPFVQRDLLHGQSRALRTTVEHLTEGIQAFDQLSCRLGSRGCGHLVPVHDRLCVVVVRVGEKVRPSGLEYWPGPRECSVTQPALTKVHLAGDDAGK